MIFISYVYLSATGHSLTEQKVLTGITCPSFTQSKFATLRFFLFPFLTVSDSNRASRYFPFSLELSSFGAYVVI